MRMRELTHKVTHDSEWEAFVIGTCVTIRHNIGHVIAIVRATHLCLRGSRIPTSQMSDRRPQWEGNAGLGLFRNSA